MNKFMQIEELYAPCRMAASFQELAFITRNSPPENVQKFVTELAARVELLTHETPAAFDGEISILPGGDKGLPPVRKRADIVALIDNQVETLSVFKGYALERENLASDAGARTFSLPPADATDKLLRYEAHLDRQLYRAMDQLERLHGSADM